MSEVYKLVFRGEVLEGQHAAVVRRKLGQLLSIDDARLDQLFSGQPMVVKAEADTETATRYQGLFRKAGARLRVVPLQAEGSAKFAPEVLPVGSDVLREDEREPWAPREIDTSHLALQERGQLPPDPGPPPPPPPDTSGLSLLDPD